MVPIVSRLGIDGSLMRSSAREGFKVVELLRRSEEESRSRGMQAFEVEYTMQPVRRIGGYARYDSPATQRLTSLRGLESRKRQPEQLAETRESLNTADFGSKWELGAPAAPEGMDVRS